MLGSVNVRMIAGVACVAAVLVIMVRVSWIGFIESDDLAYARAGAAWLAEFPYLGGNHWALRHMIVLPLAGTFALLGQSELTLQIPTMIYVAAMVALTGLSVRQVAGDLAGLIAALLVASIPVVSMGASMVYTDPAEAFFVLASLWTYYFSARSRSMRGMVLSGVLAGCAMITRETTLALLVLYLVLFLALRGRRLDFVWMGCGAAAVLLADTLFLWWASGDPMWRVNVTLRGVAGDNPGLAHLVVNQGGLDGSGVIVAPRPFQALLAVFANQAVGLLAWAAVPAAIAMARRPAGDPGRAASVLFGGLALVWFVVLSYGFYFLWIIPRYQAVTLVALCVPLSIWLAGRIATGQRLVPLLLVVGLIGSGMTLSSTTNRNLLFGERALVEFVRATQGPVRTDPATLRGATWLLEVAGLADRVSAGPPEPGRMFFYNPVPRRRLPDDWPVRAVPTGATVVAEYRRTPGVIGRLLDGTVILALAPAVLRSKLSPPVVTAVGVYVPPG